MKIILVSRDLMFISRVKEVATASGHQALIAKSAAALADAIASRGVDERGVLLLDLVKSPLALHDLEIVVRDLPKDSWVCVSFYSHVDIETAERAKIAQLGQVMPRSRFVQILPQLVAGA